MNGPRLAPIPLDQLRSTLDARLAALEKALADPTHHPSLEKLILDLARAATDEADAAAHAGLQAEQAAAASLREKLQQASASVEAQKAAVSAREKDLAGLRAEIEQVRAELKAERTAAAARDRELKQATQALAAEQAARNKDLQARAKDEAARTKDEAARAKEQETRAKEQEARAKEEARRAAEEGSRAAVERKQLTELQAALDSERSAAQARDRELGKMQEILERELQKEQAAHAREREAGAQLRESLARLERDLAGARGEADVHSKTLSQTKTETEKSLAQSQQAVAETSEKLKKTQRALKEAEARADEAAKAQRTLQQELEKARVDVTAGSKSSSHTQAELEKSLKGTQRTLAETMDTLAETLEALKRAEARWEVAEQQLAALRESSSAAPVSPAARASSSSASGAVGEAASEEPVYKGPARSARRVAMSGHFEVQVDGTPARLVDVSMTGAQVLVPTALKPNRSVKVIIPHGEETFTCKGKVMWARLEPSAQGGQLWYRGGVLFTSSDQKALEAFIASQTA